jgi:hypothetical protein
MSTPSPLPYRPTVVIPAHIKHQTRIQQRARSSSAGHPPPQQNVRQSTVSDEPPAPPPEPQLRLLGTDEVIDFSDYIRAGALLQDQTTRLMHSLEYERRENKRLTAENAELQLFKNNMTGIWTGVFHNMGHAMGIQTQYSSMTVPQPPPLPPKDVGIPRIIPAAFPPLAPPHLLPADDHLTQSTLIDENPAPPITIENVERVLPEISSISPRSQFVPPGPAITSIHVSPPSTITDAQMPEHEELAHVNSDVPEEDHQIESEFMNEGI